MNKIIYRLKSWLFGVDTQNGAFSEETYYIKHFGQYPNIMSVSPQGDIFEKGVVEFDFDKFESLIKKHYSANTITNAAMSREGELIGENRIYVFPRNKAIVSITHNLNRTQILYNNEDDVFVDDIVNYIKDSTSAAQATLNISPKKESGSEEENNDGILYLVAKQDSGELGLIATPISEADVNLDIFYNEGIREFDNSLVPFLNGKDNNGLVLLHGESGTGKTAYLKHLICSCKDTKFIFIPTGMVNVLTDASIIKFMCQNIGACFIVENSESLIHVRKDKGASEGQYNLMNICEGLLASTFKLKIICLYNNITEIDESIANRTYFNYEFKKLDVERCKMILSKSEYDVSTITEPMSVFDIIKLGNEFAYNENKTNRIGF